MKSTIHEIIERYKNSFSGAFLASSNCKVIYSCAHGYANRDFSIPNNLETKFDIASITKVFTSVAILLLVDQKKISLDDTITKLVDLSGTKIPGNVTIQHLLTHTSGIADDADEESGEDYAALFVEKPNYSIRCCNDFLPQFAYKEPYFPAGTSVRYNNCAFVLLGLAIEAIVGKDCRDYIHETIFAPCQMSNTSFCSKDKIEANRAEGYYAERNDAGEILSWRKNIYSYPPVGTPDGGAYTTVMDLERFIRRLRNGDILSAELTSEILMPHSRFIRKKRHGTWQTGYGFEFLIKDNQTVCMYKEGSNTGVDAITAYFPVYDLTVHIVSNQDGPLWNIFSDIKDAFIQ